MGHPVRCVLTVGTVPDPGTSPPISEFQGLCRHHPEGAAHSVQWDSHLQAGKEGCPRLHPKYASPYSPAVSCTWANLESWQLGMGTQLQDRTVGVLEVWVGVGVGQG